MENKNESEVFSYTYSAKEQEEVKQIRKKYMPKEADKMEQLRRLDRSVTRKGTAVSIVVGIIGALTLGIGMCCAMVWMGQWFVPGIVIGLVGIILVSLTYPLYTHITQKEREKVAPEILRLIDELMK